MKGLIMDLKKMKEKTYKYFINAEAKDAVQKDGYALQYVKNQNDEICKQAVKQNGYALQFVKNQTDEICKLAVQQNGAALRFVKEQTDEICRLAVQQNGLALRFVKEDVLQETEELTLEEVCKELGRDIKIIKGDE